MSGAARKVEGVFTGPFASRLAPTLDLRRTQNLCSPKIYCGSEPAREGARSSNAQPQVGQVSGPLFRPCLYTWLCKLALPLCQVRVSTYSES
ncbi:hypothetical protein DOZ80_20185 [Pseudomonas fluorescens]|uniref:Uncharacterized protein n=1 Tax=Pseudomonas fluorescens TaxID=294 RepID=A0A327MVV8_PSEFL|nr:hypothetical protein DOZ80_20185 [Pseudomonas fluorescens]